MAFPVRGQGDDPIPSPVPPVASILWRLDHGRLNLDGRTLIILDEAGMTDDSDWLRLLEAAQVSGAKVVAVGDHRQLGAVGPGGAFEALQARWPGAVQVLDENVRQTDPAERAALAHLRAGDINKAVGWYVAAGRVRTAPTRGEVLDQAVAAWSADIARGADTSLFAWRRANVAAGHRLGQGSPN